MQRWFKIVVANILGLVVVVGGLGVFGLYLYDKSNYISTDDARISANTINIMAPTPGKITAWNVKPGDKVDSSSTLGVQQSVALTPTTAAAGKPAISTKIAENTTSGTHGRISGSAPAAPDGSRLPSTGTAAPSGNSVVSQTPAPAKTSSAPVTANVDIKAPIAGTIIQNIVEQGQTVAAGQPLAMIADLDKVFVVANIEETRIADVKPGQSVDITLDAFPGDTFSGRVQTITRATASTFSMIPSGTTSGSFTKVIQKIPVQIAIDTAGKEILPGMSASVRIKK